MSAFEGHAKSIFFAALERSADEWPAFLDAACSGDSAARNRVDQLLRAHAAMRAISCDTVEPAATLREPTFAENPGMSIGPYRLLEQLGEGGFGVVFLAEQTGPIRRQVALKVLKPGMDTTQVIARFEAERQALAMMDHPHIAQVFDGGAMPSGRPYFVMELVHGLPITEFCDRNRLPLRERLEVFISVCQAVQHAHQKGIIHRDLKPTNILVTMDGGATTPKVIDFGVAKARVQSLTDNSHRTMFGQLIGTPIYMSPEQAGQHGMDIDTRSDVYSLGVLLYELLTGTTPFVKERFKTATYDEIRHILCEEEPPKPSARLSTSSETLPTFAALRHTEPGQLTKLVRGELDWITMKALNKDREQRYASPADFAVDVTRFLRQEPVLAGPASRWYRVSKALRRHRVAVLSGLFVLLALVGGIIGTTLGLLRARDAEHSAHRMQIAAENAQQAESAAHTRTRNALDLLTDRLIGPTMLQQRQSSAEEQRFLREIEKHYQAWVNAGGNEETSLAHQANGYRRVAQIRLQLGDLAGAETNCRQAINLYQALLEVAPASIEYQRESARTQRSRGDIDFELGRHEEAVAAYQAALARWTGLFAHNPATPGETLEMVSTQTFLGRTLRFTGRPKRAETLLRGVLADIEKRAAGPTNADERRLRADTLDELARTLVALNRNSEAEEAYRTALAEWNRLLDEFPNESDAQWGREATQGGIAKRLTQRGQFDQAESLWRAIVNTRRKQASESPSDPFLQSALAHRLLSLGQLLRLRGQFEDAQRVLQEGIGIYAKLVAGPYSTPTRRKLLAQSLVELAEAYAAQQRWSDAHETVDHAFSLIERALTASPRNRSFEQTLRQTMRARLALPLERGAHRAVATCAERLANMISASPREINEAAWCLARCAWNAVADPQLAPDEKWRLAFAYAQHGFDLLPHAALRQIRWQLSGHNFWVTDSAETE